MDPAELRTVKPSDCSIYLEECRSIHCPYGVRRTYGPEGCERCECENPCSNQTCPEGHQCAVDIAPTPGELQFVTICRQINKPGECPVLTNTSSRCDRECYTDADCRDPYKCCTDGCRHVCVRPVEKQAPVTTTPRAQIIYPGDRAAGLEEKPQHEVDVDTPAGSYATLRCYATGNPPPSITWERGGIIVNIRSSANTFSPSPCIPYFNELFNVLLFPIPRLTRTKVGTSLHLQAIFKLSKLLDPTAARMYALLIMELVYQSGGRFSCRLQVFMECAFGFLGFNYQLSTILFTICMSSKNFILYRVILLT